MPNGFGRRPPAKMRSDDRYARPQVVSRFHVRQTTDSSSRGSPYRAGCPKPRVGVSSYFTQIGSGRPPQVGRHISNSTRGWWVSRPLLHPTIVRSRCGGGRRLGSCRVTRRATLFVRRRRGEGTLHPSEARILVTASDTKGGGPAVAPYHAQVSVSLRPRELS